MVPVDGKDAIATFMQSMMDTIVEKYAAEGVELPERQYLAVGEVVLDTEQLTVSFIQMYLGPPGHQPDAVSRCHDPRSAVFQVQLTRCVPSPTTRTSGPTAQAMTDHTWEKTADAWLLMDGVLEAYRDDFLGVMVDVSVSPAQGGFQSVILNVTSGIP